MPLFLLVILFGNKIWVKHNKIRYIKQHYIIKLITKALSKDVAKSNFVSQFLIAPLFFLMVINLMGLLPYVFTVTVLPSFTLAISLIIFISILANITKFNIKKTIIHIVPKSSPTALILALVIIELISLIIRPITLTLRLIANLIAGHLIMEIIGRAILPIMAKTLPVTFCLILITVMETAVSIIQALVLTILVNLYTKDALT